MHLACALCVVLAIDSKSDERAPRAPDPKIEVELTPAITHAELEAHVRFLAADERKGRATGTPEAEFCARYLALVLAKEGLEPGGAGGSYLQTVPMTRTHATALPKLSLTDKGGARSQLDFGADFDLTLRALDVADLRVVVVKGETDLPRAVDPKVALFIDANGTQRNKWLEAAGLNDGSGFGLVLAPGNSKRGTARTLDSLFGRPRRARTENEPNSSVVRIHGEILERFRKSEIERLSLATHVVRADVAGSNVVGRVRGTGTSAHPEWADEAIVFTAHYDHLDHDHTGAKSSGTDQIWNGADDDASGTAAVLEIAGAFARGPAPVRTLVFLIVTGEEVGLLGTEEYLDHPLVPLDRTTLNLNFEMIGRPDPHVGGAGHMWLTGFELTNLGPSFVAEKIAIQNDPYPNEHYFERSDNIAFVRRGIVGQTFSTYNGHADYHMPSDEADTLDYEHMEACARAGYAASRLVADAKVRPAWIEGKKPKSADTRPSKR